MSRAMIDIRPAREADTAQILEFIGELARYERLEHEVVATEAQLRETLFGTRRYAEVLIASAADEPVGFALFFHTYSTFMGQPGIYLEDLYVTEHMRGQGVGRQLLRRLARLAIERRCARLEWAVLEWNAPAIAFYRNLGARPMEDWRTFRLTGAALEQLGA
jgi:GNAT superfamily N-acetyltransferase